MDVILTVRADQLSPDALQDLTREICRTLNREADVQASLIETPPAPGAKGLAVHLGQILLQMTIPWGTFARDVATHGAGVVVGELVVSHLRPFLDRHITITARGPDGKEHTLGSEQQTKT